MLQAQEKIESPKLLVTITIDQLRSDFMYEFEELYTPDGFKRLLAGGAYIPTATMLLRTSTAHRPLPPLLPHQPIHARHCG